MPIHFPSTDKIPAVAVLALFAVYIAGKVLGFVTE